MKKNYFFGIAAALMMGTVALSSCSSDELTVGNETQIAKEVAKTYSFSIQATMDDEAGTRVFGIGESTISSSFSTEEPVYMFINSSGVIAYGCAEDPDDHTVNIAPLYPNQNGPTCTLSGNLSFYTYDDSGYSSFNPAVGDVVYLYYGMSIDSSDPIDSYYIFETDGKLATAESMDYNLAEMKVTKVEGTNLTFGQIEDNTKTNFSFKNINSIFRQKLTFVDEEGNTITPTPTISSIVISTSGNFGLMDYYTPLTGVSSYGPIVIADPVLTDTDRNIYFSTIFNGYNENDAIIFTAYADGNTYTCTKAAPTGGFQNNRYYYGEATLVKEEVAPVAPTVSGGALITNPNFPVFSTTVGTDSFDITISGPSEDYIFYWGDSGLEEPWGDPNLTGGTITLDNLIATSSHTDEEGFLNEGFIVGKDLTLNLILKGDNVITCKNTNVGILVDYLYLSCDGDSATLTITANGETEGGIYSSNLDSGGLSAIAAPGYTVTRSEPTDNLDGSFTWTYTVTKN
ncbi:MAG: hypothetical protein IKP48_05010 [Bacteroidaceae bacterium]|nr:hypothetical protein [Bacteroidaceae bacterium]